MSDSHGSDFPVRHLNLAGASNFRDLGGYPGKDGRAVRWRQIFRSNHLGHLTEADIEVLRGLGLKCAFDFRGTEERVAAMCGVEEIAVHSLPIEPTVVAALRARLASAGAAGWISCAIPTAAMYATIRRASARCSPICLRTAPRW